MSTGQILQQIRNVAAATAIATMTGCASYAGGYANEMAYADPEYDWDNGYGVYFRSHWDNHLRNHWQDHFDARAMHGGLHGGLAMGGFGGSHGGFAGGHGRG